MGNDIADAIREELRDSLIRAYGTLDAAALAVGIPYKTLYRALTTRGKDRSQSVKLDLVVDIAEHLSIPFSKVYERAQERAAENVGGGKQADYGLVANDSINEFPAGDDGDFDYA